MLVPQRVSAGGDWCVITTLLSLDKKKTVLTQATHRFPTAAVLEAGEGAQLAALQYTRAIQPTSASRSFTLAMGLAEPPQEVGAERGNPDVCISKESCTNSSPPPPRAL